MRDITVSGKGDREPLELIDAGLQLAKLYCIADIGKHYDERYGKVKEEIVFIWELPEFRIEIEKDGVKKDLPRAISRTYTKHLGTKANLRKDLKSWRGKDFTDAELELFSLSNVLGKTCQLNIIHNTKGDKTYANIDSVLPPPRDCKHEAPENPMVQWGVGDNPELVPKWILEKAATAINGEDCIDRRYEDMTDDEKVQSCKQWLTTKQASALAMLPSEKAKMLKLAAYEDVDGDDERFGVALERMIEAEHKAPEEDDLPF